MQTALAAADPGWLVDRTTLALMSERLSAGTLAPELTTALVRRAGDLARRPDSLGDVLKVATGTRDLDNRIEAENRISLEDSAPAARVRAYEAASIINFKGMTHRKDIAAHAAASQRRGA